MAKEAETKPVVPLIDLSKISHPGQGDRNSVVQRVRSACIDVGFFYVAGHKIEPKILASGFEAAKSFFARPDAEKRRLISRYPHRGFIPQSPDVHPSRVDDPMTTVPVSSYREKFHVGLEPDEDSSWDLGPFEGPNLWPTRPAGFRSTLSACHARLHELSLVIISILAESLGLSGSYFDAWFGTPQALLTANFYPRRRAETPTNIMGLEGHTDYGFLTLLVQDDVGGLEVLDCDNRWCPVVLIPGTLVCNLGDLIERTSNGLFRATRHRVLTPHDEDRLSLGFFLDPSLDAVIDCRDVCSASGEPSRFSPVKCRDYLMEVFSGDKNEPRKPVYF